MLRVPAVRRSYWWWVVAVGALVALIGAGSRAAPGALLLGIRAETGWSTGDIALAGAAGLLLLGLGGPVSGIFLDRYGVRRVTALALTLTALGMLGAALATEVWQLVLTLGLLSGFGAGLVSSSLGPVIANRWFATGRGVVVGAFSASASAGQLVFFPLLTAIAVAATWRLGAVVIAVLVAIVAVPALLVLRERPADVGLRPRGATADTVDEPARADRGIMRRALRTPEFWLLAGTFFVCGATSNGVVGQHFIAHAVDHGFQPVEASGALALMGAFNFVGTLASGWLSDRFDPRRLLLGFYVFRGLSLLYLPFIHDTVSIVGFAVLFGLDYIATVPPTVMLVAQVFGRRNVGIVYGWVYAAHMLGAAILAWVAGVIRDTAGDYAVAYVLAGWMAVTAGVLALLISRAGRDRGALDAVPTAPTPSIAS